MGTQRPADGFPLVANKLASDPDRTTLLFRRFDALTARNLLYLQAELAELEVQQNAYDEADRGSASPSTIEFHTSWRNFERRGTQRDTDGSIIDTAQTRRFELALKIKEKLKDYHEALAVHQTLLNSKPPAETTINALKNWFLRIKTNNKKDSTKEMSTSRLFGGITTLFSNPSDLIALRVPADQDRLSVFILTYFGSFFQRQRQPETGDPDPDSSSAYIHESSLQRAIAIISSILSAIILFGSITSLYFVHNPYLLLGMLGGWTILFATCVGWLMNGKRENIFAATAAYCAVLVVFVSGSLGGNSANVVGVDGSWNCTRIASGSGSGGSVVETWNCTRFS